MSVVAVVRHWARDARVLVVGDAMLDEYVLGEVARISPEAPVPVVEVKDVVRLPGGAANVAAILYDLGARPVLVARIGADVEGQALRKILGKGDVETIGRVCRDGQRTTYKLRIFARGQQLLRCDREDVTPVEGGAEAELIYFARAAIARVQAVVLSDYRKGVLTAGVTAAVMAAAGDCGVPVLVDPKGGDWGRYHGAAVIKPNLAEAGIVCAHPLTDDSAIAMESSFLTEANGGKPVVLTRGAQGMSLLRPGQEVQYYRTSGRHVRTVIGAGDVVSAVLALGLAAGVDLADACAAANVMAGLHCERGMQLE